MCNIIKHKIIKPNVEIMNKFSRFAESVIEKNLVNYNESKGLIKTRDTLLPKLMSGEIRVPIKE